MPDSETIARARNKLDDAVSEYVREATDGAVPIDWFILVETDNGSGVRAPIIAESVTMTSWKREGLMRFLARAFSIIP